MCHNLSVVSAAVLAGASASVIATSQRTAFSMWLIASIARRDASAPVRTTLITDARLSSTDVVTVVIQIFQSLNSFAAGHNPRSRAEGSGGQSAAPFIGMLGVPSWPRVMSLQSRDVGCE